MPDTKIPERAERAYRAVLAYKQHLPDAVAGDDEAALADLLAGLRCYAEEYGVDFDAALRLSEADCSEHTAPDTRAVSPLDARQ